MIVFLFPVVFWRSVVRSLQIWRWSGLDRAQSWWRVPTIRSPCGRERVWGFLYTLHPGGLTRDHDGFFSDDKRWSVYQHVPHRATPEIQHRLTEHRNSYNMGYIFLQILQKTLYKEPFHDRISGQLLLGCFSASCIHEVNCFTNSIVAEVGAVCIDTLFCR